MDPAAMLASLQGLLGAIPLPLSLMLLVLLTEVITRVLRRCLTVRRSAPTCSLCTELLPLH